MTVCKYYQLPQDSQHHIYTFVSDQVQITCVSKTFLNGFEVFKVLKEQYLRNDFPLLFSLTQRSMLPEAEEVSEATINKVYTLVILDAKKTALNVAMQFPLITYSSYISPYRLEEIVKSTGQREAHLVKVFEKIGEQIPDLATFLETLDRSDPIETAGAIRTWISSHPEDLDQIVELDLRNLELVFLPKEISLLTHLEELNADENNLEQLVIPDTLTALNVLNANNNKLKHVVLPAALTALTVLGIKCNQLKQLDIPNTLTSLFLLSLDNNYLERLDIPETLTKLRTICVRKNLLTQFFIPETLTALQHVYLSQNRLQKLDIPKKPIATLDISQNELTILPDHLAKISKLYLKSGQIIEGFRFQFEGNPFCSAEKPKVDESKKD